ETNQTGENITRNISSYIELPVPVKECNGCLIDTTCLPFGMRVKGQYCDIDGQLKQQKEKENAYCENNFECSSNLCVDNGCVGKGVLQKILDWFKRLFGG
ncbi:MAG: hypothetical protein AB1571_03680, partial [Nanoarchaeota archaeon]